MQTTELYASGERREKLCGTFARVVARLVEDVSERVEDFLQNPGGQDLTTTVNWTHVISSGEAAGLRTVALERLDSFLLSAGLLEQLERESARAASEADVTRLRLDAREMILPGGMASHFQVLVQKKI